MPGGDRRGPMGAGPRTGRGAGYCAGYATPGYMNPGSGGAGFAYGRGRGGGRGWRNQYYATGMPGWQRASYGYPTYGGGPYPYAPEPSAEDEKRMLQEEVGALEQEMEAIRNRIADLDKAQDKE